MALINKAISILDEYSEQNYVLSLRQLYYQMVARDIVPNSMKSYTMVGTLISDARLAGLIDWQMIEDRGRDVHYPSHWSSPAEIIKTASRSFRIDLWEGQSHYVEVMVEKDALSGILEPICAELDVRFTANKGYSSSSALFEAGSRISNAYLNGLKPCVIYFGDHDPSGMDMTRDIEDRLKLFSGGAEFEVKRLALNYDQVKQYRPPENPAKANDSRFDSYKKLYGTSSWELDALEPKVLSDLLITSVVNLLDKKVWKKARDKQERMREDLTTLAKQYEEGLVPVNE